MRDVANHEGWELIGTTDRANAAGQPMNVYRATDHEGRSGLAIGPGLGGDFVLMLKIIHEGREKKIPGFSGAKVLCCSDGEYFFTPDENVPRSPIASVVRMPRPSSDRRRGVWPGTYDEYTAHPEFHRIAAEVRKLYGYKCAISRDHKGPIECHHASYRGVPFGELDFGIVPDLIPLCEDCHGLYHKRLPNPPRGLFDELIDRELKRAA